jgi:hypothetical protein
MRLARVGRHVVEVQWTEAAPTVVIGHGHGHGEISNSEVDKLSLFRPNLEVRSPRVAMLIKVWQPRVEKDGSAPLCVFEGATELRRGWHARAWSSLR